tara:strand:- start:493 stop:732 length:240 start_codon:yes stop_codon:yes gene_type:complete
MRNTEQLINANENQDLVIDCGTCVIKDSNMCKECVVTFICNRDPGEALVIDLEEERALRLLNKNGLVPPLRHLEVKADN